MRALLVRFSPDEHRLYLTLHRIVADWVSLTGIFLPELQALYEARMQRHAADLPQVERQYTDYAYWQRNRPGAERAEHLRFWKEYLAGAPATLELRADHRRPEQPQLRGGVQPFELSTQLAAGLRELSRQEQVPLRTTLTAALAALLYRYTGQQDLLIGTIPERGPGPLAQPMMGCFPNTVVHRAESGRGTGHPRVAAPDSGRQPGHTAASERALRRGGQGAEARAHPGAPAAGPGGAGRRARCGYGARLPAGVQLGLGADPRGPGRPGAQVRPAR